jgi:hypothetical protein
MADILPSWGGWGPAVRDDPFGHFAEARARCPVQKVRLADGHPAWLVLGYDAARQGNAAAEEECLAAPVVSCAGRHRLPVPIRLANLR